MDIDCYTKTSWEDALLKKDCAELNKAMIQPGVAKLKPMEECRLGA